MQTVFLQLPLRLFGVLFASWKGRLMFAEALGTPRHHMNATRRRIFDAPAAARSLTPALRKTTKIYV